MRRNTPGGTACWRGLARLSLLLLVGITPLVHAKDEAAAATKPSASINPARVSAPDWDVSAWSDGKKRSLTDYKGKVILVDFWGIWCGPCRRMIPALRALERKYGEQGVVFLSIHTPGSAMNEIADVLKQESWMPTVGLDGGQDVTAGTTAMNYGIRGYPTIVIIDRDGLIAHNSTEARRRDDSEMKALAREIGLPWPVDQGINDRDELNDRITKLTIHMLSIEIENVR